MSRLFCRFLLAVSLFLAATPNLKADYTFSLAGTFGADLGQTTGLAGGSFAGTYSIATFDPTKFNYLTSFHVDIFNASHNLVFTFATGAGYSGYLTPNFIGSRNLTFTYDPGPYFGTDVPDALIIKFPDPFNGVGQAFPYQQGSYLGSTMQYQFNQLAVTSAISAATIPEPPSVILGSGLGLLGLGSARLRSLPRRRSVT